MICIAWGGMPAYASYAVAALVKESAEPVRVVATPSDVPRTCDDTLAGETIHWIKDEDSPSVECLLGEVPRVLVVSGWFIPSFNRIADDVRRHGGKVIALLDNRWRFTLKNVFWAMTFRYRIAPFYAGYMVPGRAAAKLLRYARVAPDRIATGMYTSNPDVYVNDVSTLRRPKRIVFVGRLDARKNILPFVQAFIAFSERDPSWMLELYGQGALRGEIEKAALGCKGNTVKVHDFIQPDQLAGVYRDARVMVLPSLEDHWGVVVHEAALSGCALLLSKEVGAAKDLLSDENGVAFNPKSLSDMRRSLMTVASWSDARWETAEKCSRRLASAISPKLFAQNLLSLIGKVA